VLWCR
jgi:Retrotransposon gag protein